MFPFDHNFLTGLPVSHLLFFFTAILLCQSCTTVVKPVVPKTAKNRLQIGEDLEKRLWRLKQSLPSFSFNKKNRNLYQINMLARFVNTLPNGEFIINGNPSFLVEVKKTKEPIQSLQYFKKITYNLKLLDAKSKKVLLESASTGNCLDKETVFNRDNQCSIQEPILFTEALESL